VVRDGGGAAFCAAREDLSGPDAARLWHSDRDLERCVLGAVSLECACHRNDHRDGNPAVGYRGVLIAACAQHGAVAEVIAWA